jgi:hypothetical protein
LNQQRLENYLAASNRPNLDISEDHFENFEASKALSPSPRKIRPAGTSSGQGTHTPRDLNARVKILELYTLHVLLRNNEWDYAREFIGISEVLDEERREAFLQALQSLQDQQVETFHRDAEAQQRQEQQLRRDLELARQRRIEHEEMERHRSGQIDAASKRISGEIDYGIDILSSGTALPGRRPRPLSLLANTPKPSQSDKAVVQEQAKGLVSRASASMAFVRKMLETMAASLRTNPMLVIRMMMFMVAFMLTFGRRNVRERLRRALGESWSKVRATAGMGVKVSYI